MQHVSDHHLWYADGFTTAIHDSHGALVGHAATADAARAIVKWHNRAVHAITEDLEAHEMRPVATGGTYDT